MLFKYPNLKTHNVSVHFLFMNDITYVIICYSICKLYLLLRKPQGSTKSLIMICKIFKASDRLVKHKKNNTAGAELKNSNRQHSLPVILCPNYTDNSGMSKDN